MSGLSDRTSSVAGQPPTGRHGFSDVDYREAMRRAREIVPILRERAQETEDARRLLREALNR